MIFNEYTQLRQWREERNIDKMNPSKRQIVEHFVEEMFEMCGYEKEQVKKLTQDFMGRYVFTTMLNTDSMIDAMNDMSVFRINDQTLMGYDPEQTMTETIKEISSRKGEYNPDSGKWIKVITGNEYTADYTKCKL